jgi:hypothetical protein
VSEASPQRNAVRFAPDPGTIAEVRVKIGKNTLSLYGLVVNESRTGCALVLLCEELLEEGTTCVCRVGNLPNTAAVIRWVKMCDENLYKIGLEYLLI